MTRVIARICGVLVACLITAEAAAQNEGCALALGRTPNQVLAFQPIFARPDAQTAINEAARIFQQPGYQYIDGRGILNGGVAAAVYSYTGRQAYRIESDSTVYGAILGLLDHIGTQHDPQASIYVKWVRCTNTAYVTPEQLSQITWSNNLTSRFAGYQVEPQEYQGNYGSFNFKLTGIQNPPNPTPAPPNFSGTPVGCWQSYDEAGRPMSVFNVLPVILEGRTQFKGTFVMLSEAERLAGARIGESALGLEPTNRMGGNYVVDYRLVNGFEAVTGAEVTTDTIRLLNPRPGQNYSWRRVACPR